MKYVLVDKEYYKITDDDIQIGDLIYNPYNHSVYLAIGDKYWFSANCFKIVGSTKKIPNVENLNLTFEYNNKNLIMDREDFFFRFKKFMYADSSGNHLIPSSHVDVVKGLMTQGYEAVTVHETSRGEVVDLELDFGYQPYKLGFYCYKL